eukprot:TRINITY_DN10811_c0_g1_i1.p1 TRINITY_DN10811_c0_g1~~TRINITY_DN10811_c0_g1_i1.p1  ORF type:complete len:499 (+),score=83.19 TRINITY_DN10811_c0_g1_i1:51-1547(+)
MQQEPERSVAVYVWREGNDEDDVIQYSDPRERDKIENKDENQDNLNPENKTKFTLAQDIIRSVRVWLRISVQSLPILLAVAIFLLAYYLPAHLSSHHSVDQTGALFYDKTRYFVYAVGYFGTVSLLLRQIFSFLLARRLIMFLCLPCFLVFSLIGPIFGRSIFTETVNNLMVLFAPFGSLYLMKWTKKPLHDSAMTRDAFELCIDGTPVALVKGIVGVAVITYLYFYLIGQYLDATFVWQLFIRLVLMPSVVYVSNFLQHYFVMSLSEKHASRRLLVNVCCNQVLQFLGRLMVSNVSSGSRSNGYLVLNAGMVIVEILSRVTYSVRINIFRRLLFKYNHWKAGNRLESRRTKISSVTIEGSMIFDDTNTEQTRTQAKKYFQITPRIKTSRAQQIVEDIGTELRVLVLVPLVMYLLHPISPDSKFHTLRSIDTCFYQIFVQFSLEAFTDIVSIFVELRYLDIPLDQCEIPVMDPAFAIKALFSVCCLAQIQLYVSLFRD